jgi:hypothetical protein
MLMASVCLLPLSATAAQQESEALSLEFRVRIAADQVGAQPPSGRLLVGLGPEEGAPDFTNYFPPVLPILGVDVDDFDANKTIVVDQQATLFPANGLTTLVPGQYTIQAVLAGNPDINLPFAPGNRFCEPRKITVTRDGPNRFDLVLDQTYEARVPEDSATHKYLSIRSKLLSEFHGRPMDYRVAVVLPESFENDKSTKYGLVVYIGGFGTRYTSAARMRPDPRFVQILLDGAGPFGDPYHVDSANNGPYGQALTTEVIPHIEKTYRCLGTPQSRFTTGGSTGGWVSLALQIFYPHYFNGCWSQCPDSVTFERYELIDLYNDANAFVNPHGVDRPSTRTIDGDTISTVRHEVTLESTLGLGGRWTLSGRDWASWNAVYGPKGADGLPVPVWDGKTGAIDHSVAAHWRKYDLMYRMVGDWKEIGPKLAGGKIHVWMGDSDDYFLNAACRRFADAAVQLENPKFDGSIIIEARQGHTSGGWTRAEMLDAMAERMGK